MITPPSTALSGSDWPVSKSKTTVEGFNLVFAGAESAAPIEVRYRLEVALYRHRLFLAHGERVLERLEVLP